ncbi:MAG: Uma2 family endonuclease [Anaerolineae bacterium]
MAVSPTVRPQAITLEVFYAYAARPENAGKTFEFVHGEIIEVSPGRTYHAELPLRIAVAVSNFCTAQGIPVHFSGSDGAYLIDGHVVAPDFAYKRTPMSRDYPDPVAPLLAVEIISPTDEPPAVRNKRRLYQQAGILYWEVYPTEKSIDVYAPGQPTRSLDPSGMLDGGSVLPGFSFPVKDLFAE